jgi:DNA-binding transcriptional regulator GbsR (MarR family)
MPEDYCTIILRTLAKVNSSLSLDTLHYITGIEKTRLSKCLRKLHMYKKILKVTCSKTSYWRLNYDASEKSLEKSSVR